VHVYVRVRCVRVCACRTGQGVVCNDRGLEHNSGVNHTITGDPERETTSTTVTPRDWQRAIQWHGINANTKRGHDVLLTTKQIAVFHQRTHTS
jgi:hypothetical protein